MLMNGLHHQEEGRDPMSAEQMLIGKYTAGDSLGCQVSICLPLLDSMTVPTSKPISLYVPMD